MKIDITLWAVGVEVRDDEEAAELTRRLVAKVEDAGDELHRIRRYAPQSGDVPQTVDAGGEWEPYSPEDHETLVSIQDGPPRRADGTHGGVV